MPRIFFVLLCILATSFTWAQCPCGRCGERRCEPVKMIIDADVGSSTDDLFVLMMAYHYVEQGLLDLKGIVVDREGEKNAAVVDVFNTYYGHPDIPVALERKGVKNPRYYIPYNTICDMRNAQGELRFKRTLDTDQCLEGYKLYRKILSKAEDNSIVVVATGFATTLSRLFESEPDEYSRLNGVELFAQKVKAVYMQGGRFEVGDSLCGYNLRTASVLSDLFFRRFPESVDLFFSPSNVGDVMDYAVADVLADLEGEEDNPLRVIYEQFPCDTGQRMWDTNCLVQAVMGDGMYTLSPRGKVKFVENGDESLLLFIPDANGNVRYQIPGDSYVSMQRIMEIRRHNRMR